MNKQLVTTLLASGLLFAGSTCAAERGPHGDRMHHRGGPPMAGQAIEHLTRAIRRMDLTAEQRTAISGELDSLKETVTPLARELHEGRQELHEIITADEYDQSAVEAIANQQGQLTAEITVTTGNAVASILGYLDEDQRADLKAMGKERRAHRAEHRQKFRDRKMERRKEHAPDHGES